MITLYLAWNCRLHKYVRSIRLNWTVWIINGFHFRRIETSTGNVTLNGTRNPVLWKSLCLSCIWSQLAFIASENYLIVNSIWINYVWYVKKIKRQIKILACFHFLSVFMAINYIKRLTVDSCHWTDEKFTFCKLISTYSRYTKPKISLN